jgi:hypothetical protein
MVERVKVRFLEDHVGRRASGQNVSAAPFNVAETLTILGKPPLLENENPRAYEALMAGLIADLRPTNTIECIWIKDVADQTWDIWRNRRLKAAYLTLGALCSDQLTDVDQKQALGMANDVPVFHLFDRLIASAEQRRNATLREIQLHRRIFAQRLRESSSAILDGEVATSVVTQAKE